MQPHALMMKTPSKVEMAAKYGCESVQKMETSGTLRREQYTHPLLLN